MRNIPRFPSFMNDKDNFTIWDDFRHLITAQDGWTTLVADSGTSAAVIDGAAGKLALGTAATDNNEAMVRSTFEVFLVAAGKPMWGEWRIQFTEANTDDANVFVGWADAAGANLLVDNGAGPRASGNLVGIYKVDGGTVWRANSRNGSSVTDSVSSTTAGGSSAQVLRIEVLEMSTTQMTVTFSVDGVRLKDSTSGLDIAHKLNIASSTEMNFVAGYVKAGDTNAETLNIDYVAAGQVR